MNESVVILALLAVIIYQQVFFLSQVQKLLDKAMSRSFTEYKQAEISEPRVKIEPNYGPEEDLGSLEELKVF